MVAARLPRNSLIALHAASTFTFSGTEFTPLRHNLALGETIEAKVKAMKQTIALVDDDRNILTSVSMTLEAEGFQVRTYTDGESALQGLTAKPVDLAVLDIKMPRMDGMELLQRLRARSALPVIFLTSKDEEVDELMGLRLGADDYITKPFSQRLLIERIRALLRPQRDQPRRRLRRRPRWHHDPRRTDPRRNQAPMHLAG